jgi:NADH-quinone oxidoreductase subunit J
MIAENVAFGIIAAAMALGAIGVVRTKNVVHAALYLVVVLAGGAAQFILLGQEFVAWVQVLVYIGAVIVLFLFGIMLTQARIGREMGLDQEHRWTAALVAVVLASVMGYSLIDAYHGTDIRAKGGLTVQPTEQVADAIFRDYLIPFEVVSILLLAALIGAIVVARRD